MYPELSLVALKESLKQQTQWENALLVWTDLVQSEPVAQVKGTEREVQSTRVIIQVAKSCGCSKSNFLLILLECYIFDFIVSYSDTMSI